VVTVSNANFSSAHWPLRNADSVGILKLRRVEVMKSFNLEGDIDLDDLCNLEYFTILNLCPTDDCDDSFERKYKELFDEIVSSNHYWSCDEAQNSPAAKCHHQSYCQVDREFLTETIFAPVLDFPGLAENSL